MSKIFFLCFFFLTFSASASEFDDIKNILTKKWPSKEDQNALQTILSNFKDKNRLTKAVKKIIPFLESKNPIVYLTAYESLKSVKLEAIEDILIKIIRKQENPAALCSLMDLLLSSSNPKAWEISLRYIPHKNRAVSSVATELAARGCRAAVPLLVKRGKKANGRHLTLIGQTLDRLTGQSFGRIIENHKNWWKDHRKVFDESPLPPQEKQSEQSYPVSGEQEALNYYGIQIEKANIFFCIDTSLSMRPDRPAQKTKKKYSIDNDAFPPLPAGNGSKIWEARRELAQLIKKLPGEDYRFGIATFGGHIDTWKKGQLFPATLKNRIEAYKWVLYKTPLSYGTWLYQSLQVAFKNPEVEVIYLLTDGAPHHAQRSRNFRVFKPETPFLGGVIIHMDWILADCRRVAITQRVRINTISLEKNKLDPGGIQHSMQPYKFLEKIAETCQGTFKLIPINR
jgi:hypothetical protein